MYTEIKIKWTVFSRHGKKHILSIYAYWKILLIFFAAWCYSIWQYLKQWDFATKLKILISSTSFLLMKWSMDHGFSWSLWKAVSQRQVFLHSSKTKIINCPQKGPRWWWCLSHPLPCLAACSLAMLPGRAGRDLTLTVVGPRWDILIRFFPATSALPAKVKFVQSWDDVCEVVSYILNCFLYIKYVSNKVSGGLG